jgi:hypothetical protein
MLTWAFVSFKIASMIAWLSTVDWYVLRMCSVAATGQALNPLVGAIRAHRPWHVVPSAHRSSCS